MHTSIKAFTTIIIFRKKTVSFAEIFQKSNMQIAKVLIEEMKVQ